MLAKPFKALTVLRKDEMDYFMIRLFVNNFSNLCMYEAVKILSWHSFGNRKKNAHERRQHNNFVILKIAISLK